MIKVYYAKYAISSLLKVACVLVTYINPSLNSIFFSAVLDFWYASFNSLNNANDTLPSEGRTGVANLVNPKCGTLPKPERRWVDTRKNSQVIESSLKSFVPSSLIIC